MFNIFPNEHIILCICLAELPLQTGSTIKNSPVVLGNLEIQGQGVNRLSLFQGSRHCLG